MFYPLYACVSLKGSVGMTSIPSFKASLIQNQSVASKPAPSVDEILADKQAQPAQGTEKPHKSRIVPKVVTAGVALASFIYAGRKGYLSKPVQRLLGGKPSLSREQLQAKVTAKLDEYIARTGDGAFDIGILKNGKVRASRVKSNGNREIITFNQKSGLPEFRVEFNNVKGKKALEYTTWKGADILDEGFDAADAFYKKFTRNGVKREHLFGPKYTQAKVTYGDLVRGAEKSEVNVKTSYYNDGKINQVTNEDLNNGTANVRDFLYDKDGNVKGIDFVAPDGTILRKFKGEDTIAVSSTNRDSSFLSKVRNFFGASKRNVI